MLLSLLPTDPASRSRHGDEMVIKLGQVKELSVELVGNFVSFRIVSFKTDGGLEVFGGRKRSQ